MHVNVVFVMKYFLRSRLILNASSRIFVSEISAVLEIILEVDYHSK